jgi:tetratricopeptide (TPR) repeat protein
MTAKEFNKAIEYLTKCLSNAEGAQDIKSQGLAHYNLGISYLDLGHTDKAIHHLENYKQICKVTRNLEGQGCAFAALAKAYHSNQEPTKAIDLLIENKDLGERSGQTVLIADACANLGLIYSNEGNFDNAMQVSF